MGQHKAPHKSLLARSEELASRGLASPELFYMKPAIWRWNRALRSALSVGLPFAVGLAMDEVMISMWVAMGALMMGTSEREGPYREVCLLLALAAPIGATGYLLGYLGQLPWWLVVLSMMVIGLAAGVLNRRSAIWSIGTLQALLVASIALGIPSIGSFWQPALWYLLGAAFYALLLGIEIAMRGWRAQDAPAPVTGVQMRPGFEATLLTEGTALALCLGVAYSARWFDHSVHWFWIPLTVCLVMKPEFGSIYDRALQRILGTAIGVTIGALVLSIIPKGFVFVAIMAGLAGMLPWAMQRSYILQAIFLTPLILILIDIIMPGTGEVNEAVQRLLDTIIGGAIVILVGYLPWRRLRSKVGATPSP